MSRITGEAALVLHVRPYRESSTIVSLLSAGHGRVAVVARGARANKRGNVLQPFNVVRVGWSGRGSLCTLTGCELTRHAWLAGNALAGGFYVTELLTRLLVEHESMPRVFAGACRAIERLGSADPVDVVLRNFEKLLLEELGYGLDFQRDALSGEPIDSAAEYELQEDLGFVAVPGSGSRARGYAGAVLRDIAAGDYERRVTRVAAKQIFRRALKPLLGPRPLASRRLLTSRSA